MARRQVFFNSDENYLVPLTVMTHSLLKANDPEKGLDLYIATTPKFLSLGYDEKIRALFRPYPKCRVFFIDAEEKLAKYKSVIASELNVWSPVMWSGSLITEVVPADVTGNLVYLDVDMMVRHDLEELYSLDLEGENYLLAAVSEAPYGFFPELQKRGWGPECGDYFNYGCMVVNTDAWRREDIPAKMIAWYAKNPDTFLLNQDTSNVICGARTLRLHPRYNYFDAWVQRSIRMNPFARTWRVYPKRYFLEAMLDPYVVHYVGREKPWNFTRRPERVKYHAAMKELGLYDAAKAEGATWTQKAKLAFFNAYHRFLYGYVRLLARHMAALALALFVVGCDTGSREPIRSLKDMKGRSLAVLSGSAFRESTEPLQEGIRYVSFNDVSSEMLALKNGKVDAVAIDEPVARYWVAQNHGLYRIAEIYTTDQYSFVFKKGAPLEKEVSAVLRRLKADGTLKHLVDKWCDASMPNPPFDPHPFVRDGSRGTLRVAVAPEIEPGAFYANREIKGFEIEILRRVAWEMNCTLEFQTLSFGALIEAVSSGKADLAVSLIIITPARARAVSFSEPYHTGGVALLVRDEGGEGFFSPAALETSFRRTFVEEGRWHDILGGLGRTLLITVFAVLWGTVLAFPVWLLKTSRHAILRTLGTAYVAIFQGTPILIILMILYYVVFAASDIRGEAVAIVGFALNFAAYAGEMLRAGVAAVPTGQREAALALGFTPLAAFRRVVFPQALKHLLPVYRGEVIGLLKATSIVGYIAVVDLTKVSDLIRARTYEAFFPLISTALVYFAFAWLITFALGRVERRLRA